MKNWNRCNFKSVKIERFLIYDIERSFWYRAFAFNFSIFKKIEIYIFKFITNEYSLESKKSFGGTSTVVVIKSITKYKKIIDKL